MPSNSNHNKGEYCGQLVLDAGIEYLAKPASPPEPPKHNALSRFLQRLLGKECQQQAHGRLTPSKECQQQAHGRLTPSSACNQLKKKCTGQTSKSQTACSYNRPSCRSSSSYEQCWRLADKFDKKCAAAPKCQQLMSMKGRRLFQDNCSDVMEASTAERTAKGMSHEEMSSIEPFQLSELSYTTGLEPTLFSSSIVLSNTCNQSCRELKTAALHRRYHSPSSSDGSCCCELVSPPDGDQSSWSCRQVAPPVDSSCWGGTHQTAPQDDTVLASEVFSSVATVQPATDTC